MMCEAWALHQQAQEAIASDGVIIQTPDGKRRNPALLVASAASNAYRAWAQQFGITPASEGGLKPLLTDGPGDELNPFS